MNKNTQYFLHKHRDKIIIGAGIFVVLLVLLITWLFLRPDDNGITVIDPKLEYADYYIVGKDNSLYLYDLSGNIIYTEQLNNVIYPQNLDDSGLIFSDGAFYTLEIVTKFSAETSEKLYRIQLNKETKYEGNIVEFGYTDSHIVIKRENGSFEVINRETGNGQYLSGVENIEQYTVLGNYFVYSKENRLYSFDMTANKEVTIEAGGQTFSMLNDGTNVIAFNKFGNGNGVTTIFVLNPADLYINKLIAQKSLNIYPIAGDVCCFIQKENNMQLYTENEEKTFGSKTFNFKLQHDDMSVKNSIIFGNFIYIKHENEITIISIEAKNIQKTFAVDGDYFCPVYSPKETGK